MNIPAPPARTSTALLALALVGALAAGCASPGSAQSGNGAAPAASSSPDSSSPASATPTSLAPFVATEEGVPTRLTIDEIAVDEDLYGVGLMDDGAMDVPDFGDAAWFDPGPEPGEPGPAVVVAHVSGPNGPDVFERLSELEPGDLITIERTDGTAEFVVTGSEQTPKTNLPYDRIWNDTEDTVLRLITCDGDWDASTGHFLDNLIVYAELTL